MFVTSGQKMNPTLARCHPNLAFSGYSILFRVIDRFD